MEGLRGQLQDLGASPRVWEASQGVSNLAYKEIESPGKLFFFSNLGIGCVLVL